VKRRWTPAEDATLRAGRQDGRTYRELAAQLDRTAIAVRGRAEALGLCPPKAPNWTRAEEFRMVGMVADHRPYREIAVALGRSDGQVRQRCAKLKASVTKANGRTITAVARLMGVDQKAVAWWVAEKWLRAADTGTRMGKGPLRIVEHDWLLRFLADERHWHLWEPERIAEPDLREWAIEQRAGVRFLTTGEAGERLGLTHYAVNQLVRQGRIRAVKRGPNWLIRSDWCVYPAWLPRTRGRALTDADRAYIARQWGKRPATWIAKRLGLKSEISVLNAAKKLGLPPVGRGYWKKKEVAA
jgi:excisionase family DNA binding protein